VARSRYGGSDQINLQVLCKACKKVKGDTLAEERGGSSAFPNVPHPSEAYEGVVR
jgi:5-methylcytosine-specific restriction endonuclease McrA